MLAYAIDVFTAFAGIYQDNPSFKEIFSVTQILLSLLPTCNYPNELKVEIEWDFY